MILNKTFIKNLSKSSGITPGAQHISIKDIKYFKNILTTKSPYRFFGKNKLSYCNLLENKFKKYLNRKFFLLVSRIINFLISLNAFCNIYFFRQLFECYCYKI